MIRWLVVLLVLACARDASAQRTLYDQTRDKAAQDAVAAAKEVTSGALFAKMLANVDAQARLEADTQMAFVEQQMRAKLANFTRWTDPADRVASVLPGGQGILAGRCRSVRCELDSLRIRLNFFLSGPTLTAAELDTRLKALEAKKAALEEALKQLRAATQQTDPAVVRAFDLLADPGGDALDYAKRISSALDDNGLPIKGLSQALDRISDGLDQVLAVYGAVKSIWAGYKAVAVDPASLRPPQEELDLRLLALEQDHLKTVARIEARRDMDSAIALRHVETALIRMNAAGLGASTVRVEETLRQQAAATDDPARDALRRTLDLLHEAAAAVAEEDAAGRLGALRLSDEERRYSIRRSAVSASVYEQMIRAATQRLAAYWKSGVKATDLAALAFYLTNTIAIPAIAVKQ